MVRELRESTQKGQTWAPFQGWGSDPTGESVVAAHQMVEKFPGLLGKSWSIVAEQTGSNPWGKVECNS